jgi:ribosomal protein L37E
MNLEIADPVDDTYSTTLQCPLCGMSEKQIATCGFEYDHMFDHFYSLAGIQAVGPITEYEPHGIIICRDCGNLFFHSKYDREVNLWKMQSGILWHEENTK